MKKTLTILSSLLILTTCVHAQQQKLGGTGGTGGLGAFQGLFTVVPVFSISTNALPNGTVGTGYTQTLATANGTAPFTWTIAFGSLPPGLIINSSTGVISGTPTALGNFVFTVLATDSTSPTALTATQQLSIAITCTPLAIVSNATLPPALIGTPYNFQFNSSGGQGAVTWAASGLSPPYSLASTGLLSGTPTTANTQTFTVTATDSCPVPQNAQQAATLATAGVVVINTPSSLPAGVAGVPYNLQFAAQGGTAPYTWSRTAGALPTGLTLTGAGVLAGTPTVSGTYNFTIQVTDSAAVIATAPFTLVIGCSPLAISTTTIPNGSQGQPYNFQLTSTGGDTPIAWTAIALPNGLNLSGSGAITGSPTQTGSFTPTFTATDSCSPTPQTAAITPTLTVSTGLTITTNATLPQGTVGSAYSANMTAVGGVPPYQWTVPSGPFATGAQDIMDYALMPVGVRSNFHLTGTAYKAFRLDAGLIWWLKGASGGPWDGEMYDAKFVYQWFTEGPTFNNLSGFKMYLTPVPLWARYHVPGADDIVYTPGPNRYSTTENCGTDNLPLIDNLGVRGELTGPFTDVTWQTTYGGNIPDNTPYLLAKKWIKCTSNSIAACTTEEDYWLVLGWGQVRWVPKSCSAGVCTPTSSGSVNTIEVGGGAPTPNFACKLPHVPAQGTLPLGAITTQSPEMNMASNTGVISGTPVTAGSHAFTVQVEDSVGTITQQDMTMVTACPALSMGSTSPLPLATQGVAYSFQFSALGGAPPLTWARINGTGSIPPGLSLSSTGLLSGTPTSSGTFSFVVQATDSCQPAPSQSVQSTFQLNVQGNSGVLTIATTSPLQAATEGQAYSVTLSATGGTTPYAWSLISGSLPPGLVLGGTTPTGTCLVALPAGSGTHSGADWNNALIGLPGTLVRGNTYYLGDGAYSAYNFTTSGTTLTTIKKAIASDNCTNTGWNAGTMGSSQAIFSGTPTAWNSTGAGNYTIDGQTGTGETGSTYGIKLLNAGTCGVGGGCGGRTLILDNSVPNVTVKHVEIQGGGLGAGADATEHLIWMQGTGALLDHIFAHDSECDFMQGYGPGNFTVQNSYFYKNGNGGGSPHCQLMWANGMSNFTWRYNSVHDVGGSAIWTFATGSCLSPSTCNDNINIYGNYIWLSNPPASGTNFAGLGDGVFACINAGVICTNVRFYNNTIALMKQYNGQAMNSGNFLQNSGDFFTSQNNLYFNNNGNSGTYATTPTVDHNSYLGTGGTDSRCTTACVSNAGASDPFVASSTGNFQLAAESANVNNWFALATPYNVDALGNLRTSDRGVYQFNGSPVTTSPVGTISGTPTLTGTYNFTIQVTDAAAATATKAFQLVVSCTPLAIVSTSPIPNAVQGQAYSFQFTSSGGAGAVSWTGTSIPAGLTLSTSGSLAGTPSGSGTSSLSITATDSCLATHQTATGSFSLTTAAGVPPLVITTGATLPAGTQGSPYSVQMAATGGVPPYTWSQLSGTFPAGLSISSPAGIISGTPTTIGTSTVSLQVADSAGHTTPGTFSITISCTALAITSGLTLPTGTQNSPYSTQLASSGGTGAKSWSLVGGSLPTAVTLSGAGLVAGTPSTSGTFNPQIRVTDSCSTPQTATSTFTLTINPAVVPLQITTPPALPNATINTPYSVTLSAAGGTPPYSAWTVTVGSLPTGLTLTAGTGIIAGTPTVAGTSSFTVRVSDSVATTATLAMTLTVNAASGAYNPHCTSNNTVTNLPQDGPALPLTACINTARANTPSPGSTVSVASGNCGSLQSAINSATAGQVISVPVADYGVCPLSPAAAGNASHWITVVPSVTANLPAEGTRITPAWAGVTSLIGRPAFGQPGTPGNYMPKISSSTSSTPTISFAATAAFWRVRSFHIVSAPNTDFFQLVSLQPGASHIVLDQVWINGADATQLRNGIQAGVRVNSSPYFAIIDSYISNIGCINGNATCSGDSQGVFLGGSSTVSPDGPLKVTNNFIEVGGEGIFSGGGGGGPTTQPAADVEIAKNHVFKPLWMKTDDPSYGGLNFRVKNCLEFKNTVRALIEGNIFEDDWQGQSDQHGVCILMDSRNQNISVNGTASSNGSGTLTWISGSHFTSNVVASTCATPNHCTVTYNGVRYAAQTFVSTNQITVSPAPPALASGAFSQAQPGLNPSAAVTDITFRYNYVRHSTNGIQIANPPSDNGDFSALNARFTLHDIVMDDIDGTRWNVNKDCCSYGAAFQVQNMESGPAQLDLISIWHSTLLSTYSGGTNTSISASFGFGSAIPGTNIGHLRIYDNIAAGGWWSGSANNCAGGTTTAQSYWNCWTPVAQKCWDNNFMTTSTVNASGTGSFTHNNPPYPAPADNGFCSYGAAKGNTIATGNYSLPQFNNLNGANGGNYQLLVTSPWHNKASDGTDPGVNWNLFQQNIAGVQ